MQAFVADALSLYIQHRALSLGILPSLARALLTSLALYLTIHLLLSIALRARDSIAVDVILNKYSRMMVNTMVLRLSRLFYDLYNFLISLNIQFSINGNNHDIGADKGHSLSSALKRATSLQTLT